MTDGPTIDEPEGPDALSAGESAPREPAPGRAKAANMIGFGIALGAGIGTALGVAMNNVGIWLPVGIGVGLALGAGIGAQQKD